VDKQATELRYAVRFRVVFKYLGQLCLVLAALTLPPLEEDEVRAPAMKILRPDAPVGERKDPPAIRVTIAISPAKRRAAASSPARPPLRMSIGSDVPGLLLKIRMVLSSKNSGTLGAWMPEIDFNTPIPEKSEYNSLSRTIHRARMC